MSRQVPLQQSVFVPHAAPLAPQAPATQRPPVQVPEQHCVPLVQLVPVARHEAHMLPLQVRPLQHRARPGKQGAPTPEQLAPPHWPDVHVPAQHCVPVVQVDPSGRQLEPQRPPLHVPLQH